MDQKQELNTWEERFDKEFDGRINAGYKETVQKELKTFIRETITHAVAEERERIWLEVQEKIAVFEGDTAKSVGTRVGNYFLSLITQKE